MKIKLLIIDDHPAMIEGYKSILFLNSFGYEFEITVAHDCKAGYLLISDRTKIFDIILLDIILPASEDINLHSGIDLAKFVRKFRAGIKLMILTSHTEIIVLYDIVMQVQPEGILVKSDFSAEDFLTAFDLIYRGEFYRSTSVIAGVNELLKHSTYLDSYNRQIILLLSQGIKTKNLPVHLNLSISAIDKRKAQIKDYFEIDKGGDEEIIRAAKKVGFI